MTYKINLYSKTPVNPEVVVWQKRLFIIFFVMVFFVFANVILWGLGKYIVSNQAESLDLSIASIKEDIKEKKEVEGLYLILKMRLEEILSYENNYINLNSVFLAVNTISAENAQLEKINIGGGKYEITAFFPSYKEAEDFVNALINYDKKNFIFIEPVVEDTKIDGQGGHVLVLKGDLKKREYEQ